jgi:WD40 repeat protein/predicted Ser/Thr protein kinase
MDPRFARIGALFQAARRLPKEARAEAIERGCGGDEELRAEVLELLAALDSAPDAEPSLEVAGLVTRAWPAEAPPDGFGGFRILRRLASGGMGVVYEAEQAHPRRRVALKVLHAGTSAEGRRRFDREAEILARLHHPWIAQVHVFGTTPTPEGDSPFLAMELVDGTPLNAFARDLDRRGRLELLARVCDAVAHAHAKGVIHRDLKPSNILVTPAGEPKVLDFGVARLLDADTLLRTRTGQVIGTLAYMSPEQASGDLDRVDTRTDVYALGVLGYEMLCGRLPHEIEAGSLPDAIRRIVDDEPPDPGTLDRNLRGDISLILMKALAKEPVRRYDGAAALAEDVRRHLRDEPILARPPTATYQLRKFVRRHRALVGGVAATMAALLLGLVLALRAAREEERQRARADRNAATAQWEASRALLEAAASDLRASAGQAARHRLERIPPEHRGWAYRHLAAKSDMSSRLVPLAVTNPLAIALGGGASSLGVLDDRGPALIDAGSGARSAPGLPALKWQHVCLIGGVPVVVGHDRRGVGWTRLDSGVTTFAELGPKGVTAAAGTRDGSRIAVALRGDRGRSRIWILDAASGERVVGIEGQPVEMFSLAFSPDGALLAAAGWTLEIDVIDTATGNTVRTLRGHTGGSAALAFSPDGRLLASGSDDKTVIVWRLEDGAAACRCVAHEGKIGAVAFSPDGAGVISGDMVGTIRMWNVATGACERVLHGHDAAVAAIGFRSDGTLVSAGADGAREWDVTPGADPDVLRHHTGPEDGNIFAYVSAVAFNPEGSLLASAGWDRTVRLADPATTELLGTLTSADDTRFVDAAFDPEGRRLIAGGGTRYLWDADTGRRLASGKPGLTDRSYASSPDGKLFAVTDHNVLRLLDAETLEPRAHRARYVGISANDCAWSPDGRLIATVGTDGRCVVETVPQGKVIHDLDAHAGGALAVAFDRPGRRFATGGADNVVRVWDTESGRQLLALKGHVARIYALAFHPDGMLLASGADDNTIRLWDLERGVEEIELRGHENYVHGLAFSPDGETLASASGDNTVRIWTTLTTRERRARAEGEREARTAVAPRVDALFGRLGDARAVADAIRADGTLDGPLRRAALHLVLMRSGGER